VAGRRSRHETGQHFLAGRRLAERIAGRAGLTRDDFVVEIGAGPGLLTEALAARAGRVDAIELDPALAASSRRRLRRLPNVRVIHADARTHPLPREPFRVVASLPFGATTAILRRLLDEPTGPLRRVDVVVQWEVARKRAGGGPGTLLSAYWGAWFEFRVGYRLPAECFRPPPAVDAAMLTITRRARPLVPACDRHRYRALLSAGFERANLPLDRALAPFLTTASRRRLRRDLPLIASRPAPLLAPADWAAVLVIWPAGPEAPRAERGAPGAGRRRVGRRHAG
jgi:23S rRNA (adenine-N6)-dimethyltransferase